MIGLSKIKYFAPVGGFFLYKYLSREVYYSKEDISQHKNIDDAWVSYKGGVFDITKFIDIHPGGKEKISEALGNDIESYWNKYPQHHTQEVYDILTQYKIGVTDIVNIEDKDFYKNDPNRSEELIVHKQKPFNAETNIKQLRENYITPEDISFVRNHHPVPIINSNEYKLNINNQLYLTLDDLKKYSNREVISTIQCAGNRRSELNEIEKTLGLPWGSGAIYNAKWSGVSLKEILDKNELINQSSLYLNIYGKDNPFDCSIPFKKIIDDEVIIATKMNGKDLLPDHGYPIRCIVLGYSGAKNVKWLEKLIFSDEESSSIWQRGIPYKPLSSNIKSIEEIDQNDIKNIHTVDELPIQSFICSVEKKENVMKVKGIAYSGGGRNIIRVDVSSNNGKDWITAKLGEGSEQMKNKAWAWTFWEAEVPFGTKVLCKALDISMNNQPENKDYIWNIRGILNNSINHFYDF